MRIVIQKNDLRKPQMQRKFFRCICVALLQRFFSFRCIEVEKYAFHIPQPVIHPTHLPAQWY
jgi:hypothetical protein